MWLILLIFPALIFVLNTNIDRAFVVAPHSYSGYTFRTEFHEAQLTHRADTSGTASSRQGPPPITVGPMRQSSGHAVTDTTRSHHLPVRQSVEYETLPVADFTVSRRNGERPLGVVFTNLSTNAEAWFWDFGDGTTSSEEHPRHLYLAAGSYTVALIAINFYGKHTVTKTRFIAVDYCARPHADFIAEPRLGAIPLEVSFTCLAHNASTWSWDFGDGTYSTEQHPTHCYTDTGSYTVTLAAGNSCGINQEVWTGCITATKKPATPIFISATDDAIQTCRMFNRAVARFRVTDSRGTPMPQVTVQGYWLDKPDRSVVTQTGYDGWLSCYGDWQAAQVSRTFCVTGLEKPGCLYYREQDIQHSIEVSSMSAIVTMADSEAADIFATIDEPAMINYPNPFNATTEITYFLPKDGVASLVLYDTMGRRMCTLFDAFQPAGIHAVQWNGRDAGNQPLASGIYFCVLQTPEKHLSHKLALVK
ncbi:MAG: PKD domain-containing protein [Pseudomonadota bacterium]